MCGGRGGLGLLTRWWLSAVGDRSVAIAAADSRQHGAAQKNAVGSMQLLVAVVSY
jgi:hypothetical protein